MIKVYVAGSYSRNKEGGVAYIIDALENMRNGIRKSTELLLAGYAPFSPWLDYQFYLLLREDEKITEKLIKDYSLVWLRCSDFVYVLPNSENSPGTQREIEEALRLHISIVYSLEELNKLAKE